MQNPTDWAIMLVTWHHHFGRVMEEVLHGMVGCCSRGHTEFVWVTNVTAKRGVDGTWRADHGVEKANFFRYRPLYNVHEWAHAQYHSLLYAHAAGTRSSSYIRATFGLQ